MEDVREYLHLYLGQKFVMKITNTLSFDKYTAPMTFEVTALRAAYDKGDNHIDPILVLRRLDSMTEEEARECYNMVERKYPGRGFIANPKCSITDYTFHADWSIFQWSIAFPYLLSKGFWLFDNSAFDKGLIIDKDKM